jgi:hypothetical protein
METQTQWADTLKNLRESGETVLISAISNLPVSFTHDTIFLTVQNPAVRSLIEKNFNQMPSNLILKGGKQTPKMAITEKLQKLFGEKLNIE